MIAGLFITYFKTYSKISFIPLSYKYNISGILGVNGIGKSSILEALDYFFNRDKEWNLNIDGKKKGTSHREGAANPVIEPLLILDKEDHKNSDYYHILSELDTVFRELREEDIPLMNPRAKETFTEFRKELLKIVGDDKLLISIGINYEQEISSIIFKDYKFYDKVDKQTLAETLKYIIDFYEYVYIPKDIDTEQFMKLETKQVQVLMGESLEDILKNKIQDKTIKEINKELDNFIRELENELDGYVYKTIQRNQSKVKRSDIYRLIIDTYFSVRKLHRKIKNDQYIRMSEMSSGEKQKAIINVAHSLLRNHRESGRNLILAIDEPEASLHVSSCFEQFTSLFDISHDCRQVIFTSHWYGYLPIMSTGNTCVISKTDKGHNFDLINMGNYREELSKKQSETKGSLPYDIQLKSITDFVQSILINLFSPSACNWIICEGSSEKIYFDKYFSDEIKQKKVRVIPVGGVSKITRTYEHILPSYKEMAKEYKKTNHGKIWFITDTDCKLPSLENIYSDNRFSFSRIINVQEDTKLIKFDDRLVSPKTEIEDALNGKAFVDTLNYFVGEYSEELQGIIDRDKEYPELPVFYSLDLPVSKSIKLKEFFNIDNGEMKLKFARKYCDIISNNNYVIPEWILEIKEWINEE